VRQNRIEGTKNVEMYFNRVALVHVVVITAGPAKRLAASLHAQPGRVDLAALKELEVFLWKILANHSHQSRLSEEARLIREARLRPAQTIVHGAERGLNRIKCNRANNQQRHGSLREIVTTLPV